MDKKTIQDIEEAITTTNFAKASRAAAAAMESMHDYGEALEKPKNQKEFLALYSDMVWAYAGVFAIASTIAQLPFLAYRWNAAGEKTAVEQHPILDLLENPNDSMTGYDLLEGLVVFLECCGNGYFEDVKGQVEGDSFKTPTELWPIRPDRLRPEPNKDGHGVDHWVFQLKSHTKKTIFQPDEIVPFRYFSPLDDWFGMGSLQPAVDAITLDKQMAAWNKGFFQHGTTAEGLISTDKPLTQKEMADLGAQIQQFLKGKTRKILILSKNLKWQSISVSPKDAEFLQGRKDARDSILAALGVPPVKVGLVAEAKYANYDLQTLSFHRDTIIPKLLKIEGSLNKYLAPQYPDFETDEGRLYVEFDRTSLLTDDENMLVERFGKALRHGFITPNGVCRRLGWPVWPPDKPGGDDYYMDSTLVAVGSAPAGGEGFLPLLPEDQQLNKKLDSMENAAIQAIEDMRGDLLAEIDKRMDK